MNDVLTTIDWNVRIGFDFVRAEIFIPFPNLDLVQTAKDEGLLDPSFSLKDLDRIISTPAFNKEHSNELINIRFLFYIIVKARSIGKFILRHFVRLKPNKIFDMIGGSLNFYQNYMFFRLKPLSAWKYFRNTMSLSKGFCMSNWQKNQKPISI